MPLWGGCRQAYESNEIRTFGARMRAGWHSTAPTWSVSLPGLQPGNPRRVKMQLQHIGVTAKEGRRAWVPCLQLTFKFFELVSWFSPGQPGECLVNSAMGSPWTLSCLPSSTTKTQDRWGKRRDGPGTAHTTSLYHPPREEILKGCSCVGPKETAQLVPPTNSVWKENR